MRRITINVTAEDILHGERGEAGRCPIARACQRAGLRDVAVDTGELEYALETVLGSSKLPPEARLFVANFDDRHHVDPFTFDVDIEDDQDAHARRGTDVEWVD